MGHCADACRVVCIVLCCTLIAAILAICFMEGRKPHYYAAITSVAGLDLGRHGSLDPEFNLTLRVTSRRPLSRACIEVGPVLDVSSHGVRLAGAPAPHLCSGKGTSAQVGPVLTWGAGSACPGP